MEDYWKCCECNTDNYEPDLKCKKCGTPLIKGSVKNLFYERCPLTLNEIRDVFEKEFSLWAEKAKEDHRNGELMPEDLIISLGEFSNEINDTIRKFFIKEFPTRVLGDD